MNTLEQPGGVNSPAETHSHVETLSPAETHSHVDEHSPAEDSHEQTQPHEPDDSLDLTHPKISGFDGGTRPIVTEPSFYLSIAIILAACFVSFSNNPILFWSACISISALAITLHVLAERFLFRARKEFTAFAAPFEGVFVITLGSILPGLGLLGYGIYSLTSSTRPNILEEVGKLSLLMIVPLFNFIVWSAVRKGYLVRPRLIGLMNGLALGLSACWTLIWLKTVLFSNEEVTCKFGWVLLLCLSPFLLFAATCLSVDLWQKTESNIRRIATTFGLVGCLLSLLFVFAPMARLAYIQTLLLDARQGPTDARACAIPLVRSIATDKDLRPDKYPVGGFALAELLIPGRGLSVHNPLDQDLYFRITGKPFFDVKKNSLTAGDTDGTSGYSDNPLIGLKTAGLSLTKSQITGTIDTHSLSSSVDWTLTFHNSTADGLEARGEIEVPPQGVVSRVTLWINGEPREGAFAPTSQVEEAYRSVVSRQRDPLLVTMSAPNRILVQCFPVPPNRDMRVRIGFKVPLKTNDGNICTLELPKLLDSNFAQSKRTRISLKSDAKPNASIPGVEARQSGHAYTLSGIVKTDGRADRSTSVKLQRVSHATELATVDWFSHGKRFIVQKLHEVTRPSPTRLFVVVDPSASLRDRASEIKEALAVIPARLKPQVYFVHEDLTGSDNPPETMKSLEAAQRAIVPDAFVGGQDNALVLREALETAAEEPNSAVLWIHGPQPLVLHSEASTALDLVYPVSLYDLQLEPGSESTFAALKKQDVSNLIGREIVAQKVARNRSGQGSHAGNSDVSPVDSVKALMSGWETGEKSLVVQRSASAIRPQMPILMDQAISAQLTCLWANEEVGRLHAQDRQKQARDLSAQYRLISSVTGAVVLENERDYANYRLNPGAYRDGSTSAAASPANTGAWRANPFASQSNLFTLRANPFASHKIGLVGVPVDPRYGQSNEVGALADFGYDKARDISRITTALSFLISLLLAGAFLRGRKATTNSAIAKAVALVLVVPTIVHLVGTFLISNFGGLGSGL